MKRTLFDNVKVLPYSSGAAVDRMGFLSAIIAAKITSITGSPTAAKLKLAVTDCDTSDGTYAAAADERVFPNGDDEFVIDMEATTPALEINVPIDLLGCKRYLKITGTVTFTEGTTPGSTNAFALVLGDAAVTPVS